jgi:hypothetical protein
MRPPSTRGGPRATDQGARDVWCEVIGQAAIDDRVDISVANDESYWLAPRRCSDPSDVPSGY